MGVTITLASTNISSGVTTTAKTELPNLVTGLAGVQRDLNASRILIDKNHPLESVKDQVPKTISPILDGEQNSTFIRDGSVINVFNISGPNARVYFRSQDRSTNIANITPDEVFRELREIIASNIQQQAERSELLSKVDELERTRGTGGFVQKYSEFVGLAANHLALFTPLIPALTQWLTG